MKRRPTFLTAAETLIRDGEARVRLGQNSPLLVRDYKDRLRCHAKPFFGDTPLDKIDATKMRSFQDYLAGKELSNSSIRAIMSFVSMVLRMAHDDGLIKAVPSIPHKGHKPAPRPAFNGDQYDHLLTTQKKRDEKGTRRYCAHLSHT